MNLLATIRQQRGPWGRRVLGLFVVVWLNVALQPCAMAFGDASDHGCLHCPPVHSVEASAHNSHEGTDQSDQSDQKASPCETSASQCAFLEDFNYDGRTAKVKVDNEPGDVPVGIVSSIAANSFEGNPLPLFGIGDYSNSIARQAALNILYCVYLI